MEARTLTCKHQHGRRLAGAAVTEQRCDLTFNDVNVKVIYSNQWGRRVWVEHLR